MPRSQQLDWQPAVRPDWHPGWINGYARGLQLIVEHLDGREIDYDTVLADLGPSFAMPADLSGAPGQRDVGWWPLEPLGRYRLDFVERTLAHRITWQDAPVSQEAHAEHYRRQFEPAVVAEIDAGRPCLLHLCGGDGPWWCIVTGYDRSGPPLFGACPNRTGEPLAEAHDVVQPTTHLVIVGEPIAVMDRAEADREALRYALALHEDAVFTRRSDFGLRDLPEESTWRTGREAWRCWSDWLRRDEWQGEDRAGPHWNTINHLKTNRASAVRCLERMAGRHPSAKKGLEAAAAAMGTTLEAIRALKPGDLAQEGRRAAFAAEVEQVAALEVSAFERLGAALAAMGD